MNLFDVIACQFRSFNLSLSLFPLPDLLLLWNISFGAFINSKGTKKEMPNCIKCAMCTHRTNAFSSEIEANARFKCIIFIYVLLSVDVENDWINVAGGLFGHFRLSSSYITHFRWPKTRKTNEHLLFYWQIHSCTVTIHFQHISRFCRSVEWRGRFGGEQFKRFQCVPSIYAINLDDY